MAYFIKTTTTKPEGSDYTVSKPLRLDEARDLINHVLETYGNLEVVPLNGTNIINGTFLKVKYIEEGVLIWIKRFTLIKEE